MCLGVGSRLDADLYALVCKYCTIQRAGENIFKNEDLLLPDEMFNLFSVRIADMHAYIYT